MALILLISILFNFLNSESSSNTIKVLSGSFNDLAPCPPDTASIFLSEAFKPTFHIPIVVYIIQDPSLPLNHASYPDDHDIEEGIAWINNALAGNPACPDGPNSEDTGIQLCLATSDIEGQPTNGIIRYTNNLTDMDLC